MWLPNVHHLNFSHVTLGSCIPVAASTAAPTGGKSCTNSRPIIPEPSNIVQLSNTQSLKAANSPRARVKSCPVLLARLGRKHQVVGVGDLPKHVDNSAENPAIFLAQHRAKVQRLSRLKERPVSTWHFIRYLCFILKNVYIFYIDLFNMYVYVYIYLFLCHRYIHIYL